MNRESIGKYLSIARRAQAALLDNKLKPYGISHGQIMLLMKLYKQEGIYQQTLCKTFNINKAAVGREVKRLQDNGFIKKKIDKNDKRKKLLYLTERARKFKPKLIKILDSVENRVQNNIESGKIKTFLEVLKKICENLEVEIIEESAASENLGEKK